MRLSAPLIPAVGIGIACGFALLTMSLAQTSEERYRLVCQINFRQSVGNVLISSITGIAIALFTKISLDELRAEEAQFIAGLSGGWAALLTSYLANQQGLNYYPIS